MAIYMVTSWSPLDKADDTGKIMAKVGKMPSYIKKWRIFITPDGKKGIKGYNIIYVEDNNIAEAMLYINKIFLLFSEVPGYAYKIEPVFTITDANKAAAMKV